IELEFINALKLKQFRNELSGEELEKIVSLIQEHEQRGVFYRPVLDWPQVFSVAFDLSNKHTQYCGARSLDILHVGSALTMKAETFLTFDARQAQLADKAGLKTVNLTST
ncbi:MAG: type II toxin-antitoxin system VapC family toxin, partial [Desulfobacteraceae bacterium]